MTLVDIIGVIPFDADDAGDTLDDLPGAGCHSVDYYDALCHSGGVYDAVCHGIS